jgi:Tfp pilus assembly protein PilF
MGLDAGKPLDSAAGQVPGPSAERRRWRARAVVAGAVVLMLAGVGAWAARHWPRPAPATEGLPAGRPEDPRLTYAGPFLNVHPDVAYVGDESCAGCHRQETLSFRQHPMGRSLLPISRVAARQRYDAGANNPFEALGVQFRVERQGDRVVHRQIGRDEQGQAVYEGDTPIDYVLGSGTRGYSYLTDRDGYVFQSPVSWYSEKQVWDKSPGFSVEGRSGRPVNGMCLFCHANRVRPREGYVNRYEEPLFDGHAIGCERCHGPGGRHAKDPGGRDHVTGADYTIVNPRHLDPELRAAVCEQCHLVGEAGVVRRGRGLFDFRPGMPLAAFWSLFVRETDSDAERKAVGHVEQMYLSRCFLRSEWKPEEGKRKLGCTSCHDPHRHVGPQERVAHYRGRCLDCHRERGCSVPEATRRLQSQEDSCIDCHMPRYPAADVAHTASTDHRILRRPDKDAPAVTSRPGGEAAIIPFYRRGLDPGDKDAGRDLGIALPHVMAQSLTRRQALAARVGRQAVDLLEAAVRNDPEDVPAREALAEALALVNRQPEALAVYEAVLSGAPQREASLMGAAMLAQSLQQREPALSYWRRAVAVNPWHPYYRASLARMLADQKAWDEARPHCEAWLRLDPANIDARVLWVSSLARTGDKAAAKAEFAKIERLRPPDLPVLQARFAVELRAR